MITLLILIAVIYFSFLLVVGVCLSVAQATKVNAWINLANDVNARWKFRVEVANQVLLGCFGLANGDDVHLSFFLTTITLT